MRGAKPIDLDRLRADLAGAPTCDSTMPRFRRRSYSSVDGASCPAAAPATIACRESFLVTSPSDDQAKVHRAARDAAGNREHRVSCGQFDASLTPHLDRHVPGPLLGQSDRPARELSRDRAFGNASLRLRDKSKEHPGIEPTAKVPPADHSTAHGRRIAMGARAPPDQAA